MLDDVFGPLVKAGIVDQLCERCSEALPAVVNRASERNPIQVRVRVETRHGPMESDHRLCWQCGRDLRLWIDQRVAR